MTTNHGKVMEIGEAGICTDTMRLQIAEGTTITGFYATHVSLPYGSITISMKTSAYYFRIHLMVSSISA
jgi:hypothetical protein